MPWERTDYDLMSRVYDAGRAMPGEWVSEWRKAMAPHLRNPGAPILDVGAGTGIWAAFIADWFDREVVGLEPSVGMRRRALETRKRDAVWYVGGRAEYLPLRNDSCGAVWMSTVVHHIEDLNAAARETRRVLRADGALLIRQAFSGRHDDILWTQAFPSALAVMEERHITLERVLDAFSAAGFEHMETRRVHEIAAPQISEYVRRVETRADSSLALISDAEFQQGLGRLRSIAKEWTGGPVRTGLDLVVLH